MLKDRILRAREVMERLHLDALLVTSLPNIRYFSGFTGSDGLLLLTQAASWLLVDGRYTTQALEQAPACTVICFKQKGESVCAMLRDSGSKTVGFESEQMSVAVHSSLLPRLNGIDLVPMTAELDDIRQLKYPDEIEQLAATAALASQALLQVTATMMPGQTEQEVAIALEFAMKRAGAEAIAFDFIVASGERGALPHGRASAKPIQCGDLVTIDYGAVCNGYHSDETVTVAMGSADARQLEIYSIVKEAHDLALRAIRPGVPLADLDAMARNYISDQGYGDYFGHGLGHGVGLEIHEKPVLNSKSKAVAREGMVFTVEPGIYIPGWGGIRIEDTVVVTAEGYRLLTTVDKSLIVVAG
jgi:Xaa-Pro aminopeptidase